ncbi:ATP-binding cassette domain-containing protein [Peterkaempfera sp. SMS 1(5)a]|uniref:ATP-binding cassette domain-containing protein n=1 Tax=Peterkaempfera podocarpi TaxID=3232308 RepID=UPI00366C535E
MIQATGLTKTYRRGRAPALIDLTFEVRPGQVTVLLGPGGAGKSTAVRLLLGLEDGRGAALFGGRPYRSLHRPEQRVGVVLQHRRPAGHPGRRARGHLRMLAAVAGVPARRADRLLEQTRLTPVARHRLWMLSPAAERRLALAAALLGDPETLLLDAPTAGLSPHDAEWFHAFLRAFAASGGAVLVTCSDPAEAAALGDRVITLDRGRTVADQAVGEFVRARLRPEVAVRGPQAGRLADLLRERGAKVRREDGTGLAVSGLARSEIGEIAYRHGILLHELADRVTEHPAPRLPALASDPTDRPGAVLPADPEETVVVLSPGAAIAATVVGPLPSDRGLALVPGPVCPGDAEPMPRPSRPEPSGALTSRSE